MLSDDARGHAGAAAAFECVHRQRGLGGRQARGPRGPTGSRTVLPIRRGAHYCASKAALANLTVSGARELAERGVRCNGVAPGYIGSGTGGSTDSTVETRLLGQVPLSRSGTAEEVAAVVGFLVSPDASYLTGEIIDVDGGWAPD